jgi:hypothetical protein
VETGHKAVRLTRLARQFKTGNTCFTEAFAVEAIEKATRW